MKILIAKSPWEVYETPIEIFVERILDEGYDAAEVFLRMRRESMKEIRRIMLKTGLPLIAQIGTHGDVPEDHIRSLRANYEQALETEPLFVNSHTGRDWFCFDDNLRILEAAEELASRHGVPILHETHRGRAFFALHLTVPFLRAIPSLRLTADIAHWFCVHESGLENQRESLSFVMDRTRHIHARVGFGEGPQVSDPRNPHYKPWVERSMELWWIVLDRAEKAGEKTFALTPEFGADYTPLKGILPEPVADSWEMNSWMHQVLVEQFKKDSR